MSSRQLGHGRRRSKVLKSPAPKPKEKRYTRSDPITCCFYGKDRLAKYGNKYYFCEACKRWDDMPPDGSKNQKRSSRYNHCTAQHTDPSHPTDELEILYFSKGKHMTESELQEAEQRREKNRNSIRQMIASLPSPPVADDFEDSSSDEGSLSDCSKVSKRLPANVDAIETHVYDRLINSDFRSPPPVATIYRITAVQDNLSQSPPSPVVANADRTPTTISRSNGKQRAVSTAITTTPNFGNGTGSCTSSSSICSGDNEKENHAPSQAEECDSIPAPVHLGDAAELTFQLPYQGETQNDQHTTNRVSPLAENDIGLLCNLKRKQHWINCRVPSRGS